MRSYHSGPTVTVCPVNSSEIKGKITPRKDTIKMMMKRKLFNRNKASRENIELSWFSPLSVPQRRSSRRSEAMKVRPMKAKKSGPRADWAKACTEESTPERVRNVPKITREEVRMSSSMFQCLSTPFFSCTTTE